MKTSMYDVPLESIPVDFFGDPDGEWTYEELVERAGFGLDTGGIAVGVLTEAFDGHREGSAVVTLTAKDRPYVAIIECAACSVEHSGPAAWVA